MNILFGAMNSPLRDLLDEIHTIGRMGFDFIEITMDAPLSHYKEIETKIDKIRDATIQFGLKVLCHMPTFLSPADLTPSIRAASQKEIMESLRVASLLSPLRITIHPPSIRGLGSFLKEEIKEMAMEFLEEVVNVANELGIELCVENMFERSGLMTEIEDFFELLDRFPSIGITYDPAHAHIGDRGSKRTLEFIKTFKDHIRHVHLSDNFGKLDEHLPLGAGNLPLEQIITSLKDIDYRGTITLEVFSRDKDYLRISHEKIKGLFKS